MCTVNFCCEILDLGCVCEWWLWIFDTKSAYNLSKDIGEIKESLFNGQWVLKLKTVKTIPWIQTFVGLCFHNSIAVRECIAKRGMGRSVDCPISLDWMVMTNESIIQALRDCILAKNC